MSNLTIATSIYQKDIEKQRKAIQSWLRLGFSVVSINSADVIRQVSPFFNEVEFVEATRDARDKFGKPYIYFEDILAYFKKSSSIICGIVNSDIHLIKDGLKSFVYEEAHNSLVYGCGVDIKSLDELKGTVDDYGLDYLFFDKRLIDHYPENSFCFGLPWWNYWAVLVPLLRGRTVKKVITPVAYHVDLPQKWNIDSYISLGKNMADFFGLPEPLEQDQADSLLRVAWNTIKNYSSEIEFASNRPLVSVVLGAYNRMEFLKLTIESIRKEATIIPLEIIVVDGGSTDGTLEWLIQQKDIITIVQHNRGEWQGKQITRRSWGYFMNLGFKAAQAKYICMVSDDCLLVPNCIANAYLDFEKELNSAKKIGAISFYWRNWPEQKSYWVGINEGFRIMVNHGMYLKQALKDIGYVDEDSFFFYHADWDLCLRMWQKGYIIIDAPNSYVEHYNHANLPVRKSNFARERSDYANFQNKWKDIIDVNNSSWKIKDFADPNRTAQAFSIIVAKI